MARIREIRDRVVAIRKTQKITSAMKMISAARLARAQQAAEASRPYGAKLSEVFASLAASLEADLLVCITRHWLRDDDWLYLYGWWPDHRTPPVAFVSVAGVEGLPPEGPEADRAIANALAACLAGFLGETGTHSSGARDCPLAFNRSRSVKHLVGRQRFDASCRRKLRMAVGPGKLGALEALTKAFGGGRA